MRSDYNNNYQTNIAPINVGAAQALSLLKARLPEREAESWEYSIGLLKDAMH